MAEFVTIEDLITDPDPEIIYTGRRVKNKKGDLTDEAIKVYLRVPTDIEKKMCSEAANGARRRLRAELEDPDSEKHNLLLAEPLANASTEELRNIWINGRLIERVTEVHFNSLEDQEFVPEPEGDIVSAAEQDEYEERVEAAERRRAEAVTTAIESIRKELEKKAKKVAASDFVTAAMPAHIETLVGEEWAFEYSAQIAARCTFQDKHYRKPFFKTTEQVRRLRDEKPLLYQRLVNAHNALLLPTEPTLGFSDGGHQS